MEVIDQPSVHPVAIVTGASSGIGLEYARELCSRGYDVVMVSNEEERLTQHAEELSQTYEVQTWPLCMDLSQPDAGGTFTRFLCGDEITSGGVGE